MESFNDEFLKVRFGEVTAAASAVLTALGIVDLNSFLTAVSLIVAISSGLVSLRVNLRKKK